MTTTTPIDVLLIEATPGDGASDAETLVAAGHRVHRCHDGSSPRRTAHPSGWVPCVALTDGTCPLDGSIDVALLARRGVAPRPGPREVGVRCAIRAGVPVVEDGGDLLDPFEAWVSARTDGGGVVETCERAAEETWAPVVERLRALTRRQMEAAGFSSDDLDARFEVVGDQLTVRLSGPPVDAALRQAISTRVVDALRARRRTVSRIGVGYRAVG